MACISLFLSQVPFSFFDLRCPKLLDLAITKTIDEVIVYHSNRLHVRINDRRAYETESALLEVFAECIGFGRGRRNLPRRLPAVKLRPPVDKTPAIGVKITELFLGFEKGTRISHRRFDLHPVANNPQIRSKLLDSCLGVVRDLLRIEFVECTTITLPFFQND